MNTYQYDTAIHGESLNSNFAVILAFTSLCIGSFIGLQLQSYIDVMCVMRGECYGRMDWIHVVSLIHPVVLCLFFSAAVLMIFSVSSARIFPLNSIQSVGFMHNTSAQALKKTSLLMLSASIALIITTLLIGAWFSTV